MLHWWWRWAGALAVSFILAAVSARALAFVNPGGKVKQANSHTADAQRAPVGCRGGAGDVIVWQSDNQDGRGWGIFAQRFRSDGRPLGSEFRITTYSSGNEAHPAVACREDGSFVVAWDSDRNGAARRVFSQLFAADGALIGEETQINEDPTSDSVLPAVCSTAGGEVIVTWQAYHATSRQDVFGRRFDRNGIKLGTEFRVNSYTESSQGRPAVACSSEGSFIVTWDSDVQDGADFGIFGQRYGRAGEPSGFEFQINTTTLGSQHHAKIAIAPAGDFVVVWEGRTDEMSYGAFGQRFDNSASPVGTEFRIGTELAKEQSRPVIASDAGGNMVVAWSSDRRGGHLAAQRFANDGERLGPPAQIETPGRSPRNPALAAGAEGDFIVVWQATGGHGDDDVFAQRFTVCGNGRLEPGEDCDDGNVRGDDCCAADCSFESNDLFGETRICRNVGVDALVCSNEEAPHVPCLDGNLCTTNDYCAYGVCVGGPPPDCDDGNLCTEDACRAAKGCVHVANSKPCDDGDACTAPDVCRGGACVSGPALTCDDRNVCTDDRCDAEKGGCENAPNDARCDDGNACTTDDRCAAGTCVGGPSLVCSRLDPCLGDTCDVWRGCPSDSIVAPCDDWNACTEDRCVVGVGCTFTAVASACDDGNACTRSDACTDGVCRGSDWVDCSSPDACRVNATCNPLTGACSDSAAPDGTQCQDGDPCTVGDRCRAGTCNGGPVGAPFLVKDVRSGPGGGAPAELVDAGGRLFFRADDGATGRELWISDGTPAGTAVVDLNPGPEGSAPAAITAVGTRVFFTAADAEGIRTLWVSNATGAEVLGVDAARTATFNPQSLVAVGDRLFFVAGDEHGRELWTSDGTAAGTRLVADIRPGRCRAGPCSGEPAELTAAGDHLFFIAADGHAGREPWVSDGTEQGTHLVADIMPGPAGSNPAFLTPLGDVVYFAADDRTHGRELWRNDGLTSATLVSDIRPGPCGGSPCSSSPSYLTVAGDQLFFAVAGKEPELWRSGGDAASTLAVRAVPGFPYVRHATHTGLFFSASATAAGPALWRSDGTGAGTIPLTASLTREGAPEWLASSNGRLFFAAQDRAHGNEIWVSDGTAGGTRLLHDINPGSYQAQPRSSFPTSLTHSGRFLFFAADDGTAGRELWAICP